MTSKIDLLKLSNLNITVKQLRQLTTRVRDILDDQQFRALVYVVFCVGDEHWRSGTFFSQTKSSRTHVRARKPRKVEVRFVLIVEQVTFASTAVT